MTQKMKTAIYVSAQSVATIFKGIVLMKSTTLIMLFYRKLTAVCQVCVFSCSVVPNVFRPHGLQPLVTPWSIACQDPLSMGILQARIPEWVAYPFSKGSS